MVCSKCLWCHRMGQCLFHGTVAFGEPFSSGARGRRSEVSRRGIIWCFTHHLHLILKRDLLSPRMRQFHLLSLPFPSTTESLWIPRKSVPRRLELRPNFGGTSAAGQFKMYTCKWRSAMAMGKSKRFRGQAMQNVSEILIISEWFPSYSTIGPKGKEKVTCTQGSHGIWHRLSHDVLHQGIKALLWEVKKLLRFADLSLPADDPKVSTFRRSIAILEITQKKAAGSYFWPSCKPDKSNLSSQCPSILKRLQTCASSMRPVEEAPASVLF